MAARTPSADVVAFRYDRIFNSAVIEIRRIRHNFLSEYIRRSARTIAPLPASYEFALRSFCVLASATLEQCVEDLAWASLYDMGDEINRFVVGGTTRNLARAGAKLQDYVESEIHSTHGIREGHFNRITSSVGISVPLTALQKTAFEQLGIIRGQSAHTYAVTLKSPNEVWEYAYDVLNAARAFGIMCSAGVGRFISLP